MPYPCRRWVLASSAAATAAAGAPSLLIPNRLALATTDQRRRLAGALRDTLVVPEGEASPSSSPRRATSANRRCNSLLLKRARLEVDKS